MAKRKITPADIKIKTDNAMDELMGKTKIKPLNIDLFLGKSSQVLQDEYEVARKKWIAKELSYSWNDKKDREDMAAQWDVDNPKGLSSWLSDYRQLTTHGSQNIINKINEVIKELNRR